MFVTSEKLYDEQCAYVRSLPALKEVQGRTIIFVVAGDGRAMPGLALIYTVRGLPGVERFKIEQMSLDQTIVKVVAGAAFGLAEEARIVRDFKARLGGAADVRIERVSHLANEASGKCRYVVSHVKVDDVKKGVSRA